MRMSDWSSDVCSSDLGMIDNMRRAVGMRRHRSAGILRLQLQQLGFAKRLIHDANARPEQHVAPHLPGKITAQMLIRTENDFLVLRNLREKSGKASCRERGWKYV